MPRSEAENELVPQALVALPRRDGVGWTMEAVAGDGAGLADFPPGARVLGTTPVPRWRAREVRQRDAAGYGWLLDWQAGGWRSPEEIAVPPPGETTWTKVEFSLETLRYCWLDFRLRAGDDVVLLSLDQVEDYYLHDTVMDIVKFTNRLGEADGEPCFSVRWSGTTVRALRTEAPGWCRLVAVQGDSGGAPARGLDVLHDRRVLADIFRRCLITLADHSGLGLQWFDLGVLDSAQHDRLLDEACDLWEAGVRERRWPDDWEAKMEFEESYIVRHFRLVSKYDGFVERYRHMLRTLVVPEEWR